jgi:hypothetical protein
MANKAFYINFEGFSDITSDKSDLRDVRGHPRTKSLFIDHKPDTSLNETYYTLREYEREGYPSAYIIYMTSVDEADAAMKLVGNISHWEKLCKAKWFLEGCSPVGHRGLKSWRRDMAARDESTAKRSLIQEAEMGNVTAAKALHQYAAAAAKQKAQVKKFTYAKKDDGEEFDFGALLKSLN